MVKEVFSESREQLIAGVAGRLAHLLTEAVAARGSADFLVSGGGTPKPVYEVLSEYDLPWALIRVALVDERWVGPHHEASNEAFIRRHLLKGRAAKARFASMKTAADFAMAGLFECEQRYAELRASPDVCLLGMGSDGHTASLFPHARGLNFALKAGRRCAAINAVQSLVTGPYSERMTLTLPYLMAARHRLLLISGADKLATYRTALGDEDVHSMPVRAVLHGAATTEVYWAP